MQCSKGIPRRGSRADVVKFRETLKEASPTFAAIKIRLHQMTYPCSYQLYITPQGGDNRAPLVPGGDMVRSFPLKIHILRTTVRLFSNPAGVQMKKETYFWTLSYHASGTPFLPHSCQHVARLLQSFLTRHLTLSSCGA